MNSLRGVFPEPPPVPRRNFIRENMIHIKRMQGFVVNDAGDHLSYKKQSKQLENNATQKTIKLIRTTKRHLNNLSQLSQIDKPQILQNNQVKNKIISNKKTHNQENYTKTAVENFRDLERRKFKEIGVQTELQNKQLYDAGVIKYPTIQESKSPQNLGDGDKSKRRSDSTADKQINNDEVKQMKDYVKENASVVKSAISKQYSSTDPTKAPPTYQKGVVPKYLRDRKEELIKSQQNLGGDERCPDGHVVLPENERKETLRMLRQSYSELVSELNQLPVRSDTLKIRNRKIEIENQLKKLDEGIKVFTRPKVYVKIGV